ncbi:MAG: methyl-accepting chemotaxis protein [Lachnospiraceae bacterium]|nr:methyl-accepting chemotaxis protein [Lachnospiraceae bacterium]
MKIKSKLTLMIIIPVIICSIAIGLVSIIQAESYLDAEQKTILQVALEGYTDNVNAFKAQDVDITVFKGDTRAESSINGVVGTKASDVVIEEVIKGGNDYFDTNVDVQGTPYYGYYIPTADGMLFAGKPQSVVMGNMNNMVMAVLLMDVIFVVIFGIVGFVVARHMAIRIQKVSNVIESVAAGQLNVSLDIKPSKDEIGDICNATKLMVQELADITSTTLDISSTVNSQSQDLNDTSVTTLTAMNEVSRAIEEITTGLQGQSQATQNIAGNIGDINQDMDDIKVAADDISACSDKLETSSVDMRSKMTEMSDSNDKVNESIKNIADRINGMGEIIDQVKGIVAVIGDISAQTSLLSLNATIEAARAGEAGKGFAVVASEISHLSDDTSKQVDSISAIIATLVKVFDECTNTIEETVQDGEIQKGNLDKVIEEFGNLSKEIDETSVRVEAITETVKKTVTQIENISREIEELSGISQNSAASTEEVNASVEEINALMNNVTAAADVLSTEGKELNNKLEFFKL